MESCANGHEQVCYYGVICPMCSERANTESRQNDMEQQISDLKTTIAELEGEINGQINQTNQTNNGREREVAHHG